ncbi:hypothetical protein [Rhodoblastus sp.]|uniref:hypothetical protein n=1 Tax=Rhodoblastus sp. TaxID=1962975 RepID=UPI003F94B785
MRIVRPHDKAIRFGCAEMKDAGLAMIDPYDAMIVFGHGFVPAFSLSAETAGKSPRSRLNAKSVVATTVIMVVVVVMVMVVVVVVMIMVAITVMMMVVMLHRHRLGRRRGLGRSGERRKSERGRQNGGGKKCLQHWVSFRGSFRPAREERSGSALETLSSANGSKMSFVVVGSFRR